ncbi:hypothetical protein ABK040_012234 [Willaertia magna]
MHQLVLSGPSTPFCVELEDDVCDVVFSFSSLFVLCNGRLNIINSSLEKVAPRIMPLSEAISKVGLNMSFVLLLDTKGQLYKLNESLQTTEKLNLNSFFNDTSNRIIHFALKKFSTDTLNLIVLLNDGKVKELRYSTEKGCDIQDVTTEKKIINIDSGAYHYILTDEQHNVHALGNNAYSQCGISSISDNPNDFPIQIDEPKCIEILKNDVKIKKVCCGASHTLFLSEDGLLYVVGSNREGQLGLGPNIKHQLEPTLVEHDITEEILLENVVDISCGINYSILTLSDNRLFVTGWNKNNIFKIFDNTNYPKIINGFTELSLAKLFENNQTLISQFQFNRCKVFCSSVDWDFCLTN